ncbi:MAG: hypothetical protein ACQCXQ_15060 [Verrucomicrobiales bacterium]|nr:hypothetical protein [Verrucomicrobiota bacterium JB025]
MRRRQWLFLVFGVAVSHASALEDPGKNKISRIAVQVYYATNGNPASAGERGEKVSPEVEARFRNVKSLRFKHYRMLGEDIQPLLRSYDSWAQPLQPSDEIMVRMEAAGVPSAKDTRLDLELWLARKKTVKMDVHLKGGCPLLVLGPEWRGGRLIVSVALAPEGK